MNNYDEITAFLGNWGRFQKIVFFVLCTSTIPNGLSVLSVVFVADIPKHHCLIPEVNLTQDWFNAIIPINVVNGAEEQSRCSRYRLDVVRNLSAQGYVPGRDVNLTELQQEPCVDGWSYSKDIYQSTIVTEFDLVCSDQWKQPFTSTIYFIGVLCGSFVSGQLSDRFGRKPVVFITLGVQTLFTFLQVFSTSWTMFSVLMFFSGLGQISNYVSAFVLGAEVLSGNVRTVFTSLGVCLGFALGYMMLPLFAFFLRQWRFLLLAISLPGAVFIPLWWITPESPRWLLSQGRVEEAEAIVRKAANMNKVKAPSIVFVDYKSENDRTTVIDLFRTGEIRVLTLILGLLWLTVATGYYGLSLNTSKLSADPYISCFLSAAVEVPAYIGTWLALKYLPRRPSIIFSLCLGGVALMVIQAIPKSLPALSVTLEMIGKFSFATNAALIYPCTAEIYPTALRNTATGTFSTFSRAGICLSPFVFQLSAYFKFLPYIILGSLSIASAIVTLFLPETFGQPLPQTFEDVQKFKRISLISHLEVDCQEGAEQMEQKQRLQKNSKSVPK